MGDFFTSNSILQDAVGSEADYFRYASVVMYMQAFESYKEAKNLAGMAATSDKLTDLSRTSNDSEYLSIILAIYEELLTFYTERNYAPEKVSLYLKLGETHNRLKKTEEAKKDFENALKVYADFGDDEGKEAEARTYVDIGFVLGEENEIKSHVDQAMVAVRKMNNPIAEANTLRYIGNKLQRRWQMGPTSRPEFASEPKRAADYYAQALTLYQRSPESRIKQAETLTDLGTINLQIDKSAALDHFQKAYDLYTDKEDSQRASVLFNLGLIQEANGQWDAALKSFKEAESKFGDADFIEQLRASRAVERVKAAQVKSGAKP
jgi:tetratricopeptide (TPR) repeat protein